MTCSSPQLPDKFGVKCNVFDECKHARAGALCWVKLTNPGWGGENIEVLMRSRQGRLISIWIATKRLRSLRAAWVPEHLRDRVFLWDAKEDAQHWADAVGKTHAQQVRTYSTGPFNQLELPCSSCQMKLVVPFLDQPPDLSGRVIRCQCGGVYLVPSPRGGITH